MKNFKIEYGLHPHDSSVPVTWLRWDEKSSTCRINIKFAEETIKEYHLGKDFDMFEYIKAMELVNEALMKEKECTVVSYDIREDDFLRKVIVVDPKYETPQVSLREKFNIYGLKDVI